MEDNKNVDTVTTEITGGEAQANSESVEKSNIQTQPCNVNGDEKGNTNTESAKTNSEEKIYSQAEVDKMIQERVARIKRQPSEENENLQNTVEMLQNQLATYEKELALSKYNIKDEYKDFVDFKVSHSTDEKINYETALKNFLENDGKKFLDESKNFIPTPRPDNSSGTPMSESAKYIYEKYGKKI